MVREFVYNAGPTLTKVHLDNSFVRGVLGPVRSGKSYGMCHELIKRAGEQAPHEGMRWSRDVVVRNTYRELLDTTLQTWLRVFPKDVFGSFLKTEMKHVINIGNIHMEVLFRALDRPDDISKLLSSEYTMAWINEAREVPKGVVDTLTDRVGQIPPKDRGGCTFGGVVMDTNPPDTDHWWYNVFEEVRPEGWRGWRQPGALVKVGGKWVMNPLAENIENLNEPDYYLKRMAGKKEDYIKVYYGAEYGFSADGKPVHPDYRDHVHCLPVDPDQRLPLYIGIDFGLTPAAVFGQQTVNGRWHLVDELVTEDMGAKRFGELLAGKIRRDYGGFKVGGIWGDPAGDNRAQTDEHTCFQLLAAGGVTANRAPTNAPEIRREALDAPLTRMIDGGPGLVIDPRCRVTRKGLQGGYCYKRVQVSGEERYRDEPVKDKYSHPVEAAEYMLLSAGEGDIAVGRSKTADVKAIPAPPPLAARRRR